MIRGKVKRIAFIYEGVKTEENIFENIRKHFFVDKADIMIVTLPADGNIYMLWSKLKEDEYDTDLISVLKEMNDDISEKLRDVDVNDFAEIYLFFDYDGHNDNIPKELRDSDVLEEMLKTFDNETELGKLYISYPMVESIRDISVCSRDYNTFYLPLSECKNYKEIVGGKSAYGNYRNISKELWYIACNASRKRASLIATYGEINSYSIFLEQASQYRIYKRQKEVFIKENKVIGILNAIPLFLIEYYDDKFWDSICKMENCDVMEQSDIKVGGNRL